MSKSALLAPIPYMHLDEGLEILKEKPYVLFGTEAFEFFIDVEEGAEVLIYRSHNEADPVVCHKGIYRGYVGEILEMKRLEREGFRPSTTANESWGMYWKCADIQLLDESRSLFDIQLASGKYLESYPRGPLEIRS